MATIDRTPRDSTSRDTEKRYEYAPASTLPEPKPDPSFAYRWVATHVMGVLEPVNTSVRLRDGWEPVKAADHPELFIPGNAQGNVEVGGLMLCRMPRERAKARQRYYDAQNQAQMSSVDNNFMRNNDARMPLFSDKKTDVERGSEFGKGTSR